MGKKNELDRFIDILDGKEKTFEKAEDLYRAIVSETSIERCGEEEEVLRRVLRGNKPGQVVAYLREKHPGYKFSIPDLNKFLERNREIVRELESHDKKLQTRHLLAREDCANKLQDVLVMVESLVREYHKQDDKQATLTALKVLNQTLMNYAKILGYLERKDPIKPEIVDMVSDDHIERAKRALEAEYKMIDDVTEKPQDEGRASTN